MHLKEISSSTRYDETEDGLAIACKFFNGHSAVVEVKLPPEDVAKIAEICTAAFIRKVTEGAANLRAFILPPTPEAAFDGVLGLLAKEGSQNAVEI